MDVVVDQTIAILQILPLGNAVGGEQDIHLTQRPILVRQFFGDRREVTQNLPEAGSRKLERPCPVTVTGQFSALQPEIVLQAGRQLVEQVICGIRESSEHQHLAVTRVIGLAYLLLNELPQPDKLRITLRRHTLGIAQQLVKLPDVEVQIIRKPEGVDITQVNMHLPPGSEFLRIIVIIKLSSLTDIVGSPRSVSRQVVQPFPKIFASLQNPLQRDAETVHRRFHTLQHVDPHEIGHRLGAVHLA